MATLRLGWQYRGLFSRHYLTDAFRSVTVKDFSSGSGIKSSVKFNWAPINIVALKNVTVAGILVSLV